MKRLFLLRRVKYGAVINDKDTGRPLYFTNKMDAKAARDAFGGTTVVSFGPDHNKFGAK